MVDRSRRNFLKTSAGAAGLCLIGSPAIVQALSANELEESSARLVAFPLASVRLAPGIFKEQEEINARYLDSLTVDRLLHSFRMTAGISSGATPYQGWEEPTCELRGHFAGGHVLSAVALASACSGNSVLKSRGDELVTGLDACQKKMGTRYLSAFPPSSVRTPGTGQDPSGRPSTPITRSWPAWLTCISTPATRTHCRLPKVWGNGRRSSCGVSAPTSASACCALSMAA